jgi:hypothetical protein
LRRLRSVSFDPKRHFFQLLVWELHVGLLASMKKYLVIFSIQSLGTTLFALHQGVTRQANSLAVIFTILLMELEAFKFSLYLTHRVV